MGATKRIFCFGEVLWDEVDGEDFPGGAPLNVAYHLAKSDQLDVYMISSVGDDAAGKQMLSLIADWGIDGRFVQTNPAYSTGRVVANVSDKTNVSYDILQPVAWDHIEEEDTLPSYISENTCLIFGSLACRNSVSRQTLTNLLATKCWRVFDINLRGHYYDVHVLSDLLRSTDLLKINEEELAEVTQLLQPASLGASEPVRIRALMGRFGIREAMVTRGAAGASFYTFDEQVDVEGVTVPVADTIGCGDAFLAAFLRKRLAGDTVQEALTHAAQTGAFIATQTGGCPPYTLADLEVFTKDK